jgi:hypothetical protein
MRHKLDSINKKKRNKYTVLIYLFLMCVQYIPIEGLGVSNIKVIALVLAPFILFANFRRFSKAFVWAIIYFIVIIFSLMHNIESFRLSTIIYKISFVLMFIMVYDMVYYKRALTIQEFYKFLKFLIYAYTITLIVQQFAIIIGFRSLPIINLTTFLDRGIGSNSLSLEPSHSARILTVVFLIIIRLNQVQLGSDFKLTYFFKQNKWVVLGFVWSMITMYSGTSIVGLLLVSLYFVKKKYFLFLIISSALLLLIPIKGYKPLKRFKDTISATLTLDIENITKADHSASGRIIPLLNTVSSFNEKNKDFWFGSGVDTMKSTGFNYEDQQIGDIKDYGFISFLVFMIFVFRCCITKLWSIETFIFIFMMSLSVNNVAYSWGILMLFATSKYFLLQQKKFIKNKSNKSSEMIN